MIVRWPFWGDVKTSSAWHADDMAYGVFLFLYRDFVTFEVKRYDQITVWVGGMSRKASNLVQTNTASGVNSRGCGFTLVVSSIWHKF